MPPPPPIPEPLLAQRGLLETASSPGLAKGSGGLQTGATSPSGAREPAGLPAYIDRGMPIPDNYGLDRLVGLVRDPQWLFCYWELHGPRLPEVRAARGQAFLDACAWVLRLYRINDGDAVDMEIEPAAGSWYIRVERPGRYLFELGLLSPEGEWISLVSSYSLETPREGPSEIVDEEWRMRPEDKEAIMRAATELAEARKRGVSGFLGASRLQSSFALVSSMMLGGSLSGRPVAGSWGWSFIGASGGRVSGSGSGSGGFGWMVAPSGAHEPVLERPLQQGAGPNWNLQRDLPSIKPGKTQQAHFKVKLPRVVRGLTPPPPTWPPVAARAGKAVRRKPAVAQAGSGRRGQR
ncbi:MAG: DUF4912 domain-containing protein [Planctomycetota bacterium]|nr:DUF4912 domain-containing protein [Planctomycetota bacterium]